MRRFLSLITGLALGWTARGWAYQAPQQTVKAEPIAALLERKR